MEKTNQVDKFGNIVVDNGEKIIKKSMFCEILTSSGIDAKIESIRLKDGISQKIIVAEENGKNYAFLISCVTYLGKPHPIYKKRIQLRQWWKFGYDLLTELGYEVVILGTYKYGDNVVLIEFLIEKYENKKTNNSSVHLSSEDLQNAVLKNGITRFDRNKNQMNIFPQSRLKEYFNTNDRKNLFVNEEQK